MTNASESRGRSGRMNRLPLATGLFLVAGLCATVIMHSAYVRLRGSPWGSAGTTWEGVSAALAATTKTDLYRAGARGLNGLISGNAAEKRASVYRLAVDFLRGLTPQQVEVFRRGHVLRGRQLSPAQLRMWVSVADSLAPGSLPRDARDTGFLVLDPYAPPHRRFKFQWTWPPVSGGGKVLIVMVYFRRVGTGAVAVPTARELGLQ